MKNDFLVETDSENYCYHFEIPFYLKLDNVYEKVLNIINKYDIENIDSCEKDLENSNIDVTLLDHFLEFIENNDFTSLESAFEKFVNREFDGIKGFNKEYNDVYEIGDVNFDDEIAEEIENDFNSEEFEKYFDEFDTTCFKIIDFNYKNSSFIVEVCAEQDLENDQIHMISEYIKEQCKDFWGEKLLEKEIHGCYIQTFWEKKDKEHPKKYNVKFIGMLGPTEDMNNDDLDYDLDY